MLEWTHGAAEREMSEDMSIARPVTRSAAEAARAAWEARTTEPRRALALAREALQARPSSAVSGLALAATAVASVAVHEPEEAITAADQVPQLLAEGAEGEIEDAAAVLIETKLATLRAAFPLDDPMIGVRAGQEALNLARLHQLAPLEARAHSELGALYGSRELLDVSLRHMHAAIASFEAQELPVPATLLNNIGNIYLDTGRLDEALGCFTSARLQFEAEGDRFRASLARSNEGRALIPLGRWREGIEALEEAVAWQDGLENRSYYSNALAKAAEGHATVGDVDRAEERFRQALAVLAEQTDPFEDEVRWKYGDYLMSVGRAREALEAFERGHERARATQKMVPAARLLERLALALAALGRFEEAYARLREHVTERGRLEEESSELLLRMQLVELEATLGQEHELNVVARQAVIDANRELRERTRHLEGLSITDDLTALFNRRYFRLRIEEEGSRARRLEHDLVLMLVDVDHFKAVNDRFSHSVGDKVLVKVAALLRRAFRETDVVARWGGEEFAVLLPGFSRGAAQAIAERTREQIASHDWGAFGAGLALTVSIGIAALSEVAADAERDETEGAAALLDLADSRLYEAKRLGRNRIV